MQDLKTLQTDLKNRIPQDGIAAVIKALKELLPEEAPKRNTLLQIEAEYNDIKLKSIDGILDDEALRIANNQIRKRLLDFIDSLEASDFDKTAKRSRLRKDNQIKQGHVLYRIPRQMQVAQEVKCIVRIALDKISLIEDIDVDEHTQVRSEVRVSDYMKVQIIDPSSTQVFNIRSTSEPVQFIDEDAATEWKFYVTPLLPGEHILELKVVVMEIINGVERVREHSLEESVVIVTEAVEEDADAPMQFAGIDFLVANPEYYMEAAASSFRLPKAVRTTALMLVALLAISGATWAIAPQEFEWVTTRYLQNTKEAYERYIEKFPKSRHRESATYRKAVIENSPEAYEEYLEVFPEGDYAEEATWELAEMTESPEILQFYIKKYPEGEKVQAAKIELQQLEESTWQRIKTTNNRDSLQQFIKTFPTGRYAPEVQKVLQATPVQQKTLSPTTVKQIQTIQPTVPVVTKEPEKTITKDSTAQKTENNTIPEEKQPIKEEPVKTEPVKTEEKPQEKETVQPPNEETKQPDDSYFEAIKAKMVLVKGGTFQMGSNEYDSEKPVHPVTVSDFYISKYEVTFDEYDAFCEATKRQKPADQGWGRGKRPVINVSWEDATAYCKWLSEKTGKNYRLPTEAEWEYAARGGAKSEGFEYSGSDDLDKVAWYSSNSKNQTHPVGQKKANELGLYDMSGNVWEWVQDWYGDYSSKAQTNPKGPGSGASRVLRGGSWIGYDDYCRVADRDGGIPILRDYDFGFRLVQD